MRSSKDKVLAKYPQAECKGYAGKRFISFHVVNGEETLGIGDTVRGAWRAAAAKINPPSTRSA